MDIAIDVLSLFQTPDGDWSETQLASVYKFLKISRYGGTSPVPIPVEEILEPFEKWFGRPSDIFWLKMEEEGFPYRRRGRIEKVLKSKKILTLKEYEYVSAVTLSFWNHGLISREEMLDLYIYGRLCRKISRKSPGIENVLRKRLQSLQSLCMFV